MYNVLLDLRTSRISTVNHEVFHRGSVDIDALVGCPRGGGSAGVAAVPRAQRVGSGGRAEAAGRVRPGQEREVEGRRRPAGCRRRSSPATSSSSPPSTTASCTRSPTTAPTAGSLARRGAGEEARGVSQDRGQPGRLHARDRRQADRLLLRLLRPVLLRPGGQGALEVRNAAGGHRRRLRHRRLADHRRRHGRARAATRRRTPKIIALDVATGIAAMGERSGSRPLPTARRSSGTRRPASRSWPPGTGG